MEELQNQQVVTCFNISQKVQLTYKLFLLENARKELHELLNSVTFKAYEDVLTFLNSSFPPSTFLSVSETLDAKCQVFKKLSDMLKKQNIEPLQVVENEDSKTSQNKPIKERSSFKFGPMLKNMFLSSSIGKAVQVLGASLHFDYLKYLFIPQKCASRDDKVGLSQTIGSEIQNKDAICSVTSNSCNIGQDAAILVKAEQSNVEKCLSHEKILPADSSDIVKANAQKLLLPPIPTILPASHYQKSYVAAPITKWGREDDIQVQHQKQTSTQLLHFLKVKTKNTGMLNGTVLEWHNSFVGLLPEPYPAKTMTKQTYQFKQEVPWPSGMTSETENYTPLFKVKQEHSGGSLTYTCVIATKTELWDIGDIVTDLDSENSSVSSEETAQTMPPEELPDGAVEKDEAINTKMHSASAITIPEFQNKRFEEMEVVVSHIVDPGNFYIQHTDANEKLQSLFSEAWEETDTLADKKCIPDIGTKVMGWFPQQNQWCRSQVTKICGVNKDDVNNSTKEISICLEVKRLDYGDSFCLSLTNLKELTSEMAVLPLQAIQVSLAHVSPVNGRDWSDEAVGWLRHMVHKRTLYARLYPEGHRILVDLFLEKGKIHAMRRSASLSLRLTQNGHAKHSKLKNGVGTVQLKMKKKDSEWEKYLISCYTQSNSRRVAL